jgi:hypothetical protein
MKADFGLALDLDAPLNLALAGQSIPLSNWRRRRVQLLATNKHASAVMPTPPGVPDGCGLAHKKDPLGNI